MSREYIEPSNEQLAKFMVVYASTDARAAELDISEVVLEKIFEHNETHRQACLKIHREFQMRIYMIQDKIMRGDLQCEHIRPNGKRCPNHNQPGKMYCGLHQAAIQ